MKILLINPNRYHHPPVPPLGLEYIQSVLKATRHESRILDLCFKRNLKKTLAETVKEFAPQLAGISIRNIDTALYQNNLFFLDEIKTIVERLSQLGVPSLLGGSGYSFNPAGILSYLGASWGISGPGEKALIHFLDSLEKNPPTEGTVVDGWRWGVDPNLDTTGRGVCVDYPVYMNKGGIAGFETQKGCFGTCSYCLEASLRVIYRRPQKVVRELKELLGQGVSEFHLCDSEFNQNLKYCHEFLQTLISARLPMSWTLYMKSTPYDKELFRLLGASGAKLVTLSLPTGRNGLKHAARIRRLTKKYNIRLAVDYLCGFPGQTPQEVGQDIEGLRRIRPDTVGLNSFIRLYPGAKVSSLAQAGPDGRRFLFGELKDNCGLIRPVFFSSISTNTLKEITGDDPIFRIEGFERTTNYERLKNTPL